MKFFIFTSLLLLVQTISFQFTNSAYNPSNRNNGLTNLFMKINYNSCDYYECKYFEITLKNKISYLELSREKRYFNDIIPFDEDSEKEEYNSILIYNNTFVKDIYKNKYEILINDYCNTNNITESEIIKIVKMKINYLA